MGRYEIFLQKFEVSSGPSTEIRYDRYLNFFILPAFNFHSYGTKDKGSVLQEVLDGKYERQVNISFLPEKKVS